MTHFKFKKTLLAVSATAAFTGMLVNNHAQAANDSGQLNFIGQIAAQTCVLSLGDTNSTNLGSRTLNLGTYTTAAVSNLANNADIGFAATATLSLKDARGAAPCVLAGTTKWDIGVDLPANRVSSSIVNGVTFLLNQAPVGTAATNVNLVVFSQVNAGTIRGIDYTTKNSAYGTLLSGNTAPTLVNTDSITVYAGMRKTGVATAGAFQASMPLLVWYK